MKYFTVLHFCFASLIWISVFLICKYSGVSHIEKWNNNIIIMSSLGFGIISVMQFNRQRKLFAKRLRCEKIDLYSDCLNKDQMGHFKGIFANGGTGYLLQDKIVFVPHKCNFSRKTITVLFADIMKISPLKIWGIMDIGLKISLKSEKEERFVVDKSNDFYHYLISIKNL